jgi:hypothetical protein
VSTFLATLVSTLVSTLWVSFGTLGLPVAVLWPAGGGWLRADVEGCAQDRPGRRPGEDNAADGGEDEHADHAAARVETVEQEAAYRRGIIHRLLGFLGFATLALGLLCGNYQKWLSRNKRVAK